MMTRMMGWVVLAVFMSFAPLAYAQSDAEVEQAQQHFRKGAEWFASGEYAKAIVEFTSGHALAPNAMFLYNVSLCYERLENIDDALGAAQRAKEYEGMPPEVAQRNESRIVAFRILLNGQRAAKSMSQIVATTEEDPDQIDTRKTETRPDGITALGWSGMALAGVGVGFIVGGIATNSSILNEIETYEAAAAANAPDTYSSSRERIERQQTQGKIFYGIGFAAAGLGAALFVVDLLTGTEEVPVATVIPLTDGAAVQARFHF